MSTSMSTQTQRVQAEPCEPAPGAVRARISDGIVALLRRSYGRGPEQARTYYLDDLVVCVLRGGFTRVEQMLIDGAHGDAVLAQRHAFQKVMADEFKAIVREATGREVIGFISGNDESPNVICEVFLLEPADGTSDEPPVG